METIKETLTLSNGKIGFFPKISNLYFLLLGVMMILFASALHFINNREIVLMLSSLVPASTIFSILMVHRLFKGYEKPGDLFYFLNKKVDKDGCQRDFYVKKFWEKVINTQENIKIHKTKTEEEKYLVQSLGGNNSITVSRDVLVIWENLVLFHFDPINNHERELEGLPSSLRIRE